MEKDGAGSKRPGADPIEDGSAAAGDRDFVAALERGLAVIQAFTNQSRQMSISQVSYKTGLTRAAVRRYLHTLTVLGYANCHDGTRYSLSPKIVSLGNAYLSGSPLSGVAQPILDRLSEAIGEASSLAVRDGMDIVYIARATSSRILSPSLNVGGRLPCYATSIGLVLLAHLRAAELDDYLARVSFVPYTRKTIVSVEALRQALARVLEDGYAISDQQIEAGLTSIAVPVRDRRGTVVSGINVLAPTGRVTVARLRTRVLPLLTKAAEEMSRQTAMRQ
jgi:IclR family pca regulon transcriptional regulator